MDESSDAALYFLVTPHAKTSRLYQTQVRVGGYSCVMGFEGPSVLNLEAPISCQRRYNFEPNFEWTERN